VLLAWTTFICHCIYVDHLNSNFFLILMHLSACHLDENWLRYKIIIMTSWYNGNLYLFVIVYIYVHHLNDIFLLILMHLNICYLNQNWVRYEAFILFLKKEKNYLQVIDYYIRKPSYLTQFWSPVNPNFSHILETVMWYPF